MAYNETCHNEATNLGGGYFQRSVCISSDPYIVSYFESTELRTCLSSIALRPSQALVSMYYWHSRLQIKSCSIYTNTRLEDSISKMWAMDCLPPHQMPADNADTVFRPRTTQVILMHPEV